VHHSVIVKFSLFPLALLADKRVEVSKREGKFGKSCT